MSCIFLQAYYCVLVKGCLEAGENVLVHAGMSPIGQAVIAVTLQLGGNVIASVSSKEEANDLLNLYPSVSFGFIAVFCCGLTCCKNSYKSFGFR